MAILHLSQLLVISRLHLKQLLAFLLLKEFDLQGLLLEDKMIGGQLLFKHKSLPLHAEDNGTWNEVTVLIRSKKSLFVSI